MANIPELYTDQIVTVGSVKRVYFHFLHVADNGTRRWYYFGTTAAQQPPTTADPVTEVTYVQFPQAFDNLGPDTNPTLLDLAIEAGKNREGLQGSSNVNVFSNTFEVQGTTRVITFFLWTGGTWYYFGVPGGTPRPDPGLGGSIVTVADIRFPRDFGQLGAAESDRLYNIGRLAGMKRENIQ